MTSNLRSTLPEIYLVGAVILSLVIAAVLSLIPAFSFASFPKMALILIAADLVLYVLMKAGVVKASRGRPTT